MKVTSHARLMNVETGEYPLTLSQVRQAIPNVSLANEPDEEELAEKGYAVVHPSDRPDVGADVTDEGPPDLQDGKYVQTWLPRWFTPEEKATSLGSKKLDLLGKLEELRSATLYKGAPYAFPDGTTQHIQLRDGDRANLTGLGQKSERLLAANSAAPMFFRTFENELRVLTPQQMYDMTDASMDLYMLVLSQIWTLEGQIKAAASEAELPELPEVLVTTPPTF